MTSMEKLAKVNIIGDKYFNVFQKDDGTLVAEETTKAGYEALAVKDPTNPTMDGATWIYSFSRRELDTASGYIEKGQYFVDGDTAVVFSQDDTFERCIPSADVAGGDLDKASPSFVKAGVDIMRATDTYGDRI